MSDAEEDVAPDVTTPRTVPRIHTAPPLDVSQAFSHSFYTQVASERHQQWLLRNFISDRRISLVSFDKFGVTKFLKDKNLFETVSTTLPSIQSMVLEFYANLEKNMYAEGFSRYEQVYVQG